MFDISPVTGTLGALITGIDLAADLDDESAEKLNDAFVTHKVLFFRDQLHLTPERYIRFGGLFGELDPAPFLPHVANHPEIAVLANSGEGHVPSSDVTEQRWHSDASFLPAPPSGSILRAVKIPPYGRDTLWADMTAAFEGLSSRMQRMIDGLTAYHDWARPYAAYFQPGKLPDVEGVVKKVTGTVEDYRDANPAMEHPVVRTHPVTGKKAIFVNPNFTIGIAGMRPDESRTILGFLYAQVQIVDYQVRFNWEPGSIAMWDNRSTQHAVAVDYPYPRVMHRLTVKGSVPA